MTEQMDLELEGQIQALLCDELDSPARDELLSEIAHDDRARDALGEMLELQRQSRAAFGYDQADETMQARMSRLAASLPHTASAQGRAPQDRTERSRLPHLGKTAWLVSAAAAIVVAVSLYVAVSAYRSTVAIHEQLAQLQRTVSMPQPTPGQLAKYRKIWDQLADPAALTRPWVLLRDGKGEFGYLPATAGPPAAGRLVLLRCLVTSADGRSLEQINLLLPARRALQLSLSEACRLGGKPVRFDIVTDEAGATIGLAVGDQPASAVGVKGRARVGEGPVEIGQFQLNGRKLRVVLHVVPLGDGVG